MAWTRIADVVASNSNPLVLNTSLNVQAGDLLIIGLGYFEADVTCSVSGGGQTWEVTSANTATAQPRVRYAYARNCSAVTNPTITITLGGSQTFEGAVLQQQRPPAGTTTVLDGGPSFATGNGTVMTSGTITTTGDDIAVGVFTCWSDAGKTASLINGTSAPYVESVPGTGYASINYLNLTTGQTAFASTLTSAADAWAAGIIAFKAVSSGAVTASLDETSATGDDWSATAAASGSRADSHATGDSWTAAATASGARADTHSIGDTWTGQAAAVGTRSDTSATGDTWSSAAMAFASLSESQASPDSWSAVYVAPGGGSIEDFAMSGESWDATSSASVLSSESLGQAELWSGLTTAVGASADVQTHGDTWSAVYNSPGFSQFGSVLIAGQWKTVIQAYICVGGQWKQVSDIYVAIDNQWKSMAL